MLYLTAGYDTKLVVLSIVVAVLTSYSALNLAGRVNANEGRLNKVWLFGGALSMGIGVWSMHFIGMLAFTLPIRLSYDIPVTLLSLFAAIAASGVALFLVNGRATSLQRLCASGTLMGLGISVMHYLGMFAMRMHPAITYKWEVVAASVGMAIVASTAALWIISTLRESKTPMDRSKKAVSAVVMGGAIVVMHYTAIAAAEFDANSICLVQGGIDGNKLTTPIALAILGILNVTIVLSALDLRLASKTATLIRSLQHANEKLQHLALHDSLTRLPNRTLLEDRATQAISSAQRSGAQFALMFLDLDRFKTINDSLGHRSGDQLLHETGQRLTHSLRGEDTVARVGGDEFVVLLKNISQPRQAASVAEKILALLSSPFSIDGHELSVTCSIGLCIYPDNGRELRSLLANAESAMHHAKQTGRGNYQFYTAAMQVAADERSSLEKSLRRALENNEFELHYQPKVDIASEQIIGMEALLRWHHPRRGLVPPAEFIPLAEEIGLIVPLGAWVLKAACQQNKHWQAAGLPKLRVAVNLSAVQFRQKNLAEVVSQVLSETGLDASDLEVEVTESVVMQNAEEAALILHALRAKGIHISVDDFGTGYSSLSYLKRFPLDTLKIDRSFIRDIISDPNDAAIVKSVIALAHSLRLRVIAEGVETEPQLLLLRSLGCDEYQGYYRSRPLPAAEFGQLLMRTENCAA